MAIGVAGGDSNGLADLRLTQHKGACCGSWNYNVRGLPLVCDCAQAIDVRQSVGCGERLSLCSSAGDGHRAGWQVVDVHYGSSSSARH